MVTPRALDLRIERLAKSFAGTAAVRELSLEVPAGTMVALIGPSGCGKTTTLRMIAGLETADAGRITAGGRVLTDGATAVPPEQRDMGMVFQSYALWPHMTVARNVGYGLVRRKRPAPEVAAKVAQVLDLVGMATLSGRYPAQLSGGQQQRVALARAIATEPGVLLFDEPLSNLDAVLREQMRFEIRSLQQRLGITGVYVTHSQDEALVLSDRIAVMRDGRLEQVGTPTDVYDTPVNEFVANFIGLANILPLASPHRGGHGIEGRFGDAVLRAEAGAVEQPPAGAASVALCVRPTEIRLSTPSGTTATGSTATGTTDNCIAGTVRSVTFTGGLIDYWIDSAEGRALRVQSTPPVAARVGQSVHLNFSPARTVVLAA